MHAPSAKGSYIDFHVSPTITAIGPLAGFPRSGSSTPDCEEFQFVEATGLNNPLLMSNLSIDFARALKDLAAIFNDLKHLSSLGDLPISLHNSTTLRVRFPGCDADTVESLCTELNIRRGIVGQDPGFDSVTGTEMALLFPFAPSNAVSEVDSTLRPRKKLRSTRDKLEWRHMLHSPSPSASSPGYSHLSETSHSHSLIDHEELHDSPHLSSPSGYSSLHSSELGAHDDHVAAYFEPLHAQLPQAHAASTLVPMTTGYEGVEGIHRFLRECDRAQR